MPHSGSKMPLRTSLAQRLSRILMGIYPILAGTPKMKAKI
jgi:hypothetical protein